MLAVSTFLSDKVESYLGTRNYAQLLEDVCSLENIPHIRNEGMDLITKLCENGLTFAEDEDSVAACTQCLHHVVHNYKPKESLICLLEQGERFVNSDKFTCLLPSLQFVMMNLPKKREKTFSWVLSTLKSHVKYYRQVPDELKISLTDKTNDETLIFEQDSRIRPILQTYQEYLDFYTPFVKELEVNAATAISSHDISMIESIRKQRDYLRDYLVDLLGIPLIHFDLDWKEQTTTCDPKLGPKIKTDARIIAEKIMNLLFVLDRSPLDFLQWIERRMNAVNHNPMLSKKNKKVEGNNDTSSLVGNVNEDSEGEEDDEEEVVVHMSSIVSYLYLIVDQRLPVQKFTSVYSPTYMFNMILYPVSTVLKHTGNILALKKAIRLANCFIHYCDNSPRPDGNFNYTHRLDANLLKKNVHTIFIERLFYLAIYCQDATIRNESYTLYKQYLSTFEPQGKHDLIQYVINTIPSDSLVGLMITELKQFIHIAADDKNPKYEKGMVECFLGTSGARLIASVCKLKNGVTTDLSQHSNQIVASLNLLRYLLHRDKHDEIIGILGLFPKIEESLLNPLRQGLNLSRAHYELKLKELNDPHLLKERQSEEKRMFENLKCGVKIGNEEMKPGDISIKDQKASLVNCLNTFDHMTGLLAWVYEAHTACTSNKK